MIFNFKSTTKKSIKFIFSKVRHEMNKQCVLACVSILMVSQFAISKDEKTNLCKRLLPIEKCACSLKDCCSDIFCSKFNSFEELDFRRLINATKICSLELWPNASAQIVFNGSFYLHNIETEQLVLGNISNVSAFSEFYFPDYYRTKSLNLRNSTLASSCDYQQIQSNKTNQLRSLLASFSTVQLELTNILCPLVFNDCFMYSFTVNSRSALISTLPWRLVDAWHVKLNPQLNCTILALNIWHWSGLLLLDKYSLPSILFKRLKSLSLYALDELSIEQDAFRALSSLKVLRLHVRYFERFMQRSNMAWVGWLPTQLIMFMYDGETTNTRRYLWPEGHYTKLEAALSLPIRAAASLYLIVDNIETLACTKTLRLILQDWLVRPLDLHIAYVYAPPGYIETVSKCITHQTETNMSWPFWSSLLDNFLAYNRLLGSFILKMNFSFLMAK
jgi:hypothetical protein